MKNTLLQEILITLCKLINNLITTDNCLYKILQCKTLDTIDSSTKYLGEKQFIKYDVPVSLVLWIEDDHQND